MKTKMLEATKENIALAGEIIASGGLVAFPTETVYGLGADALSEEATDKIYRAKGRPSDNPMIVHISDIGDIKKIAINPCEDAIKLMEAFWPGPLTIILNKKEIVPARTTGGLSTVAIRMPDSYIALELIRNSQRLIAAPSANISGSPSPTRAKDVVSDMDGKIDAIILGDDCKIGIESTVVDMTGEEAIILRPGIITAEDIKKALRKDARYDRAILTKSNDEQFKPKAPGMKYKHYAPKAEVIIIKADEKRLEDNIEDYTNGKILKNETDNRITEAIYDIKVKKENEGKKVGIVHFKDNELEKAAHDFFSKLRDLDKEGVDIILARGLDEDNELGFSIMNRMLKAAGNKVIKI